MIRRIAAAFQSLLATLTGIYLYAIAAQHSFGNNQIHFFVDEVRGYYDKLIYHLVDGLGIEGYQAHNFEGARRTVCE